MSGKEKISGTLVVIQGATGVGKSALAAELAKSLNCSVISADSRQFYKEMSIGTAVPSKDELSVARHYFIQDRSVTEPLNAGTYADEALVLLKALFAENPVQVMAGGSGLYVNSVLYGMDDLPKDDSLRQELDNTPLEELLAELSRLDPNSYSSIDKCNRHRVVRAVEVCRLSGKPYSSLRQGGVKRHDMKIINVAVDRPREELYARINERVNVMMEEGLLREAESVLRYRDLPPLCTVGYRELFDYMDGKTTLERAVELIKQNTRHYAKRQLTWLRADNSIKWIPSSEVLSTVLPLVSSAV